MRGQSLPHLLLYLGFFTSGFLVTGDLPVVGEKLAIPDIFLTTLVGATVLAGIRRGPALLRIDSSVYPLAIAGTAFVYHGTISMLVNGIVGGAGVLEGTIAILNYWYGLALFLCAMLWLDSWERVRNALLAWLAGAAVVSLVGVWGITGTAPAWAYDGFRVSSTLKGVNQMQSYLAPALFAFLLLLFFGKLRIGGWLVALICLAASMVSLLATGSRASTAIILICFLFVGAILVRRAWHRPGLLLIASLSAVALLAVIVPKVVLVWTEGAEALPQGTMRTMARPILMFKQMTEVSNAVEALGPRGEQLRIVLSHWYERPIFGVGPDNFKIAFDHKHEVHNSYLGVLIEHGALGLVLYLLFAVGVLVYVARCASRRDSPGGTLMLYILAGSTALVLLYGMSSFGIRQRIFWLTLGMAAAGVQIYSREKRLQWRSPLSAAVYPKQMRTAR